MRIGIVASRYNMNSEARNVVSIVPEVEYVRVRDLFGYLSVVSRRLNQITHKDILTVSNFSNQFYDFGLHRVDLMHFFNGISYGSNPWVSSFETVLPRFQNILAGKHELKSGSMGYDSNWQTRKAFEALAGDACKRIIAMSECNAAIQTNLLEDFGAYKGIEKKLVVMLPPQRLLVTKYSEKAVELDGKIKFMLVASSFFRKGGKEIIETFLSLREKYHYPIELTIISPLYNADRYAIEASEDDIVHINQIIQANSAWIKHYPQLPNNEVLALMVKSHIGLLPTYADTFGYSVLEFQAAGCPVITTNVRALPEINDNEKGWIFEVPKKPSGDATYTTTEGRQAISTAIRRGLEQAVHEIFADRTVIPIKAEKAIAHIEKNHSVADFAARMKKIYLDALSS
jgi:glycosyltransferase involved in cell wall biosynthesis